MHILNLFIYLFFSIWLARNILYWLFLWQIKEYRLDRLLIHLKETNQGRELFTRFDGVAKLILILAYLFSFSFLDENTGNVLFFLLFSVYFYDFLFTVRELAIKRLKKPVMTVKTFVIGVLTFGIIYALFIQTDNQYAFLPIFDKIATILVAVLIGLFSLPSRIYHSYLIDRAKKKMLINPQTTVIGITGCYGKGSTKEYTASILGEKFNVLKTFESHNTPIGIAQTILKDLSKKTEIFLVEIGAYKLGETAEICNIVRPQIGIVTPVEDQHLSLFGNLKNLKKATYELVESLPRNGIAIFDGNSMHTKELYDQTDGKRVEKVLCYVNTKGGLSIPPLRWKSFTPLVIASNIKVEKFSVSFDVVSKNKKLGRFITHLLGAHHIENILPGIFLALHFGINKDEVKKAVAKIIPWKKTMEPYKGSTGAVLVDDTFNASPGATAAAVDYMQIYNGKKTLVLQPFIELGENAPADHVRIGEAIGNTCDHLFLTNNNFYINLNEGVKKSGRNCTIKIADPDEIVEYIHSNTGPSDAVVFEGKEAGLALNRIQKHILAHGRV